MNTLPPEITSLIFKFVMHDSEQSSPTAALHKVSRRGGTSMTTNITYYHRPMCARQVKVCNNFWLARCTILKQWHLEDLYINRHSTHYDSVLNEDTRWLILQSPVWWA